VSLLVARPASSALAGCTNDTVLCIQTHGSNCVSPVKQLYVLDASAEITDCLFLHSQPCCHIQFLADHDNRLSLCCVCESVCLCLCDRSVQLVFGVRVTTEERLLCMNQASRTAQCLCKGRLPQRWDVGFGKV